MLLLSLLPSAFTPFLSAALGFAGWFLKEIWEGLKDIFDNLSTILTVVTLMTIASIYGLSIKDCPNISKSTPTNQIWVNPFKADG